MALRKRMPEPKTHLPSLEMPNIWPRGIGNLAYTLPTKTKQKFGNTSGSYGVRRRVFGQLSSILPHFNYK